MSEYWFARRFPVGNPRNAMAPVTREGRMAFVWFVLTMLAGAVLFAVLAAVGKVVGLILGAVAFVVFSVVAGWRLLATVVRHGDQNHTVEDYRMGRVRP